MKALNLNQTNEKLSQDFKLEVMRYTDSQHKAYVSNGKGKVFNVLMSVANKLLKNGIGQETVTKRWM